MEWGISTFTYPWAFGISGYPPKKVLTLPEFIEKALSLDARIVQIAHNVPLDKASPEELELLRVLTQKNHIAVELGTIGIRKELLLKYLELAEFFGSRLVRTILDEPGKEISLEESIERIQEVLPLFAAKGIFLAIENHDRRTK